MLSNISFKQIYSTKNDDIPKSFYNKALGEAVEYNRVSGYFSGASLSYFSAGLKSLLKNNGKFRLIVSHELSETDYNDIVTGYVNKKKLERELIAKINLKELNLDQRLNLGNLGFLIEIGLVDIKIGFTTSGLFHAKFGIFKDKYGNLLYFSGSLNETEAAFVRNYEEITVLESWKGNSAILKMKLEEFELLWNNELSDEMIFVKSIDEIVKSQLISYSNGGFLVDKAMLRKNAIVIYYDDGLKIQNNLLDKKIDSRQRSLKKLIKKGLLNTEITDFRSNLNSNEVEEIIACFNRYGQRTKTEIVVSNSVETFISLHKFEISEIANRWLLIKKKDRAFEEEFNQFAKIVQAEISRPLFDLQLWVSFYHTFMKRSANFSVPGAGKTSMVYGVFAYLSSLQINKVNKILVIGPKNSFLSWKEEFKKVFGDKRELTVFDVHSPNFAPEMFYKNTGRYNLFLINYESLSNYEKALNEIIDEKTLLVFDEVHKIKRIDSVRSQIAIALSQNVIYRIVLTGTPIPNSYQDIWNFLQILYSNEYSSFFGYTKQQLSYLEKTEIDELNQRLAPFFWRVTKQQLNIPIENEDHLLRVIATDAEQAVINLLWRKFSDNPFKLYIRLIQLSSNPELLKNDITSEMYGGHEETSNLGLEVVDDSPNYTDEELRLLDSIGVGSKFNDCIRLSQQLYLQKRKHIIWCIFINSIEKLRSALVKCGLQVAIIYGAINAEEREKIILDFQNQKYDVLITNPHTLAESVSLHMVAHDAIYYEFSFNLTHMLQSRDRIHRLGLSKEQETNYFYLMLDGQEGMRSTIDDKIYKRLNIKKEIMVSAIETDIINPEFTIDERNEILEMMRDEM
ncbi:DEAD/DEAH box helicase family protein [Streptococcus suis]|nr:DEAD/DEAH box helicase family protein [Streptococcus suis]HEM4278556.1 DEAD/DEAH box helicase family protein [Streptococcus suis]